MSNHVVLVTGINGYIGSHIGLALLKKGYIVRGTSRSASAKDNLLREAFKGYEDQYQHYTVSDMTVPHAFDKVVKNVHAIIHVASPIDFSLPSVDAFIIPASGGVTSILNSAQSAGPQLKFFVLTSSIAAVADAQRNPVDHFYDEADWNLSAEPAARQNFAVGQAYGASKVVAEQTLWKWRDANKPSFAVSAINPGFVYGPPIVWPESPDRLNESLAIVWKIYSGQTKEMPPAMGSGSAVDVRDVAAMHIWCAEHVESDGNRYLTVTGKMPPQAHADLMRELYPVRDIIVGDPGHGYVREGYQFPAATGGVVTDKMMAALGGKDKLVPLDKMIIDTVEAFEKRWPGYANNYK